MFYVPYETCRSLSCVEEPEDIIKVISEFTFMNANNAFWTWLSWAMYFAFIAYLCVEQWIYWVFISFQKNTPFNQLDQKKGAYQALEKKVFS